tara:strand:- start:320 stop:1216 length:897 start_codon:yes stop_codon:yes gene_type:complete
MAITKVIPGTLDFNQANSESGLSMPTGGAFSGTPAEGMMRNDTSQSSASSASTMQHYTGNNEWKNFVNTAQCTTTTCSFPTGPTAVALFQMDSSVTDTCGNFSAASTPNLTYSTSVKKYGTASAEFNGTNAEINITGIMPSSVASDYAVSLWAYADNLGASGRPLFSNLGAGGSNVVGQAAIVIWNSKLRVYMVTDPAAANFLTVFDSVGSLSTGQWYNIVVNVDVSASGTDTMNCYVNGSAFNVTGFADTNVTTNTNTQMGSLAALYFWDGYIDQVRVYTSTISSSQAGELNTEVGC